MAGNIDTVVSGASSALDNLTSGLGGTIEWAKAFIDKYALIILGIVGLSFLVKSFGIKIKA